jgi:hypothetical protein
MDVAAKPQARLLQGIQASLQALACSGLPSVELRARKT